MNTEKQLQQYIKRQAVKHGVMFDKIESRSRRGFPDLLLAKNGKVIFAELKTPVGTGRVSAVQEVCIRDMKNHGLTVFVIDSKDLADDLIADIC